jgi:hypothetical protein
MKKSLSYIAFALIIAFFAIALAFSSPAFAYENGDFQIWHTEAQDITMAKGVKAIIEEEFRFGEDASELFYQHYDWGIAYAFDKRLEMQFGYRFVLEKYKHKWREEDEPYTNITAKLDLWKFKFEDRNRIEYRHFRYADDQARYRNRFMLKYPINYKTIVVAPYSSDEIFISSNGTGFNQNRFQSGMEFVLTKYVKTDISYMMQQSKVRGHKWSEANVLWMKMKLSF